MHITAIIFLYHTTTTNTDTKASMIIGYIAEATMLTFRVRLPKSYRAISSHSTKQIILLFYKS